MAGAVQYATVDKFLRVYIVLGGLMEIVVGLVGTIAASNQLQSMARHNQPALSFPANVTTNNWHWGCLWLSLAHIVFGFMLVADESGYVPAIRGYMAWLRSSRVKGIVFLFIGLLMMGLADTLGFVLGLLMCINGLLQFFLGHDRFAWRTYYTNTTVTTRTARVPFLGGDKGVHDITGKRPI